ncbi:hypothetical protein [Nocardioides convexus]|uniref:hypothetical protein n=1 Tax=Nocardioides convexus TaxID=2712224 RepID=UPI00241861F1|nr:hypothetical protein [Nocardioides convexus]
MKNHRHSANNPYAQFQDVYTLEEILASRQVYGPLTKPAVLADLRRLRRGDPRRRGVRRQARPRRPGRGDHRPVDGHRHGQHLHRQVGAVAGRQGDDTHGRAEGLRAGRHRRGRHRRHRACTTASPPTSLLTYEALGLCGEGEAGKAHRQRRHDVRRPLGRQPLRRPDLQGPPPGRHRPRAVQRDSPGSLRGTAEARQVESAAGKDGVALQHNIGLGGAVVVTAYRKARLTTTQPEGRSKNMASVSVTQALPVDPQTAWDRLTDLASLGELAHHPPGLEVRASRPRSPRAPRSPRSSRSWAWPTRSSGPSARSTPRTASPSRAPAWPA